MTTTTRPHIPPRAETPPSIIAAIIGVSVVASLFLAWLVYYHQPTDVAGTQLVSSRARRRTEYDLHHLPARRLRLHPQAQCRRTPQQHVRRAHNVDSLLVSYIVNHAQHGDMRFLGRARAARRLFRAPHLAHRALVIAHAVDPDYLLSLAQPPIPHPSPPPALDWPLWLYVSVSGVIVYAMLAAYR